MTSKSKNILVTACALGALSVMIGAFGSHGLKPLLMENGRLDTFEIGVKYQFYHTMALLAVGIIHTKWDIKLLSYAAYSIFIGTIIFSGSLYILCITNTPILGAITPFGGVLLILGWILFLLGIMKIKKAVS
ncbi:DUF423 domain-containing protein [Fulvivirga sediminis]|uniref:DUF423 domain-containing protein n=1 Tax=Fulvivirga sediminis TaxID=2803949 RepID=A0A937K0D4_9BACT|nr:DUF423 domain-containing protein [Fulvivirga sediminis]MBL3656201.1 DUF423 domain-containing protein [Fulvivirga sediminis]